MRIKDHVILGEEADAPMIEITFDGKPIKAKEGEPILAALLSEGVIISRYTVNKKEPRGLFCGIGQCTDCAMIVNGQANVRTCITPVERGMVVETQYGIGGKDDD
ncbi:MAG: (2Fe-2S)-binding protein [Clostridiales Family XIII bacterium]|nr:(2Fe-2S)-binding protein [Clostridiales Family XIII bacterium]